MNNLDEQIDKLKPFNEREKEIFTVGALFGVEEARKKFNKKISKYTSFEIEISED